MRPPYCRDCASGTHRDLLLWIARYLDADGIASVGYSDLTAQMSRPLPRSLEVLGESALEHVLIQAAAALDTYDSRLGIPLIYFGTSSSPGVQM